MAEDSKQYTSATKVISQEALDHMRIREVLATVAGEGATSEDAVVRHAVPKNKVSIPEDMPTAKAAKILAEATTAEQESQDFILNFTANPYDGAVAFHNVLKTYFGTNGRPIPIKTMFGPKPPQMITIEISYNETIQVTWGRIEFAPLEGTITLGFSNHADYGDVFQLNVSCPKKYAASVEGLRKLIESELAVNSIYRGQAVRLSAGDVPRFINLQTDDSIVYNDDVRARLDHAVWAPLRHTELLRDDPKTKIDPRVLLYGPYGTGKSECGRMTARFAVDNGWTFISYDSGKGTQEDLRKTLQTAKLFAPSVVFVEDIDIYAEAADSGHSRSRLLEMFDGISSKGHEVMVVMTSNKEEKLDKGMMRPGRIDSMIGIGNLDRKATAELFHKINDDVLADEIDLEKILDKVAGFEPAFLRSCFSTARQRGLVRNADTLKAAGKYLPRKAYDFKLTTEDFIEAADILMDQHEKHSNAKDESKKLTINDLIREEVAASVATRVNWYDSNGDEMTAEYVVNEAARQLNA